MQTLIIENTESTPHVRFDPKTGHLKIQGISYPEDTELFYRPIILWIYNYIEQLTDQEVTFNLALDYFNSSSAKVYMNIFRQFREASKRGLKISVNWYYDQDDPDMKEIGREFQKDFDPLPFNLIENK